MGKIWKVFLVTVITMLLFTACSSETTQKIRSVSEGSAVIDFSERIAGNYKVALITDNGDITDRSFNQTTYEACKTFCAENCVDFEYYKPEEDSTKERVKSVKMAIEDGYNVIVMPGYSFGAIIAEVSADYKDVMFIALDVAEGDLLEAGVALAGETYDYNPSNWELTDYVYMDNVYCAVYQEELSGYMAGYAAVKMGYRKLGYLGGMAVPVVMRFGYGFIQGAEAAALELGLDDVAIKYAYGNQFFGDAVITDEMTKWYQDGTEVVFACGGGIYSSAAEAASKNKGKVIGVDTDQAAVIDAMYGQGITVTSAMKGLYPTTIDTLTDVVLNNNWTNYSGKVTTLGLVSKSEVENNYVQLPYETTQWTDTFTAEDYVTLVGAMYDKTIEVSNDVSKELVVEAVTVENLGNLK